MSAGTLPMSWTFNPFTSSFDQKGSGGGTPASAFFAGEVATYAELPLDGTAALNSRWLVRSNSGTWPFASYKQAGIYIRTATGGTDRTADYTLTDTSFHDVMSDAAFLLFDDADPTKSVKFEASGITTGTTRTLTVPNASGTISLFSGAYSDLTGKPTAFDPASPGAIGGTTAAAGTFTTLNASGTTELINGTSSAGPLNIYNTYTSGTSFERAFVKWDSNVLKIGSDKGSGGGSARALEFQTDGTTRLTISTTGSVTSSGAIISGSFIRLPSTQSLQWLNRATMYGGGSDGILVVANFNQDNFGRLAFGGTTSSFPSLKRSATSLQARLADDTDYTSLQGKLTTHANAATETVTCDKTLTLYDAAGTAYKVPCVAA